jgi:hypothetical protein
VKKLLPLIIVLLALAGCDDVKRDRFGGLLGLVGQPPVAFADVEVYDATEFVSLHDSSGRIGTAVTSSDGRFSYELSDDFLGRPLILVVRPSTTLTTYFDYGAAGSPDVSFDNQPWVSVIPEWLGGEFACAVNPLTTMAFHSLMNVPASEVGSGLSRFSRENVDAANSGIATAFGLSSNLSQTMPSAVVGGAFPAASNSFLQDNRRSASYSYVCVQLAVAANVFVTAAGSGDALDFYDALFLDARDGAIDGQEYGTANPYLASALSVIGSESDGSSSLLNWLSTQPLSATDEGFVDSTNVGFEPDVSTIIDLQSTSTGSGRMQRIDSFDVINYSFNGATVLTVRGQGFRTTDVFEFQSFDDSGASFEVGRDDTGLDGEYQFHSANELRMLIPDFANTTKSVHAALQVASGADFRQIRFRLHSRPDIEAGDRDWFLELSDSAKVTDRTEPLLVSARIGRVNGANELESVPATNAIYPATQDPAALVVGTDDVYELRLRVANPNVDGINNMALDLTASIFEQQGSPVTPDVFGGGAANRAIIFEGTLPSATMNAGDVTELVYRFVVLDTAIGVDITAGVPIDIMPVLSGVSQGTGNPLVSTADVSGFDVVLAIGNADPDATAEVGAVAAPTMPASITAGDSFDVVVDLSVVARVGGVKRDLQVETLTVTLTFDGETVVTIYSDAFEALSGPGGSVLTSLETSNGSEFPIVITSVQTSEQLTFSFNTDSAVSGTYEFTIQVDGIDLTSGAKSTSTSSMATMTVAP